ncbi:MAG: hypothetical protein BWY98_01099 [Tenericutes bacterium ADurb.BinA155]|jgi:hypothetical protein|nr:MAG: hypothetical protein BWY98_01099 [Tenericutes bacterium ADurb.BinA155]
MNKHSLSLIALGFSSLALLAGCGTSSECPTTSGYTNTSFHSLVEYTPESSSTVSVIGDRPIVRADYTPTLSPINPWDVEVKFDFVDLTPKNVVSTPLITLQLADANRKLLYSATNEGEWGNYYSGSYLKYNLSTSFAPGWDNYFGASYYSLSIAGTVRS